MTRATASTLAQGVVDCQVLAVEPNRTLSCTWAAHGLERVVTWTLTPTSMAAHLRMEQSGLRPDQQQACQGAKYGWQKFFANLNLMTTHLNVGIAPLPIGQGR